MTKKVDNKIKQILSNIASLGSATLINAVLAFVVGIVTRNILGPEKFGYWLTVSIILTFTPLLQLGTLNAMNREVPFYKARNDIEKINHVYSSVFLFMKTIPLYSILILVLMSTILFFTNISMEYKIGFLFVSLIAGLNFLTGYVEMYYKSDQQFRIASKYISLRSISQSILTLIFVFLLGYVGLYMGMLFGLLIVIIMARNVFPNVENGKNDIESFKNLIKIGFPILLVGIVWSLLIASDRIIIALLMKPEDVGNYGVGMLVFSSVMLLPQVIGQVLYPKIVELVSLGKYKEIKRLFKKINSLLLIISLLLVGFGYLILPSFINMYMPEYIGGIKAAQILLVGIIPLTLVGVAANFLNSTLRQKEYLIIQGFVILLNIVLSIYLISLEETIESVAIATSISFFIYSIIMNVFSLLLINKEK